MKLSIQELREEFQADRKIDIYNLELEAQKQPDIFGKWKDRFNNARNERRAVGLELKRFEISNDHILKKEKAELERVEASVKSYIRKNWSKEKYDKPPNNDQVNEWLKEDKDYQKQNNLVIDSISYQDSEEYQEIEDRLNQARLMENVCEAACEVVKDRGYMITTLKDLYTTGYYSEDVAKAVTKTDKDEISSHLGNSSRLKRRS